MKKISSITILVILALVSCKKNGFGITERLQPDPNAALLKVAPLSATTVGFNVLVYLNGTRVSYPLAYNTPFPGGGLGTGGSNNSDFMVVTPGSTKIEFFVPNTGTETFASKFFETTQTLEAGKKQILFVADTSTTTSAWIVNVDGDAPDSGFARLQYVNAIPNSPSIDFYKGGTAATATLVASDVKYKGNTPYINAAFGADSFFIRTSGAPITALPIARGRIATANQRLYTVYSRGYAGITGARAPGISAIINQ